jgi:phospholipase D
MSVAFLFSWVRLLLQGYESVKLSSVDDSVSSLRVRSDIMQKCGIQLASDARFCDRCGQDLTKPRSRQFQFIASGAMIGAIVIIVILLVASIPKVPVSQQNVTTTQTQLVTTTQYQTITVTETIQTGAARQLLEYCFSPGGNCASVVVKWIDRANSSIHILIYSFTLSQIGDAIVRAKQRNPDMDIRIAWDNSQVNGVESQYQRLKSAGINIRIDHRGGLLHDKVAIIDDHIVVTGSFNWSTAADTINRENLAILDSQAWAAAYEQQFQLTWAEST